MKYLTTIFMALAFFTILKVVQSTDFKVGGDRGWAVPPSNDTEFYNKWTSQNRFKVKDTLQFVYKRHEETLCVMHSKEDHDKCHNASYAKYYDDGDDIYVLDRPGYFYFISCILDNCLHGHLKMVVKVLEHDIDSIADETANQTSESVASVLKMESDVLSQTLMIVGIIAMFTVFYM
uniref:early nodulin-like protein 2 n=1 Tax=Erigeron canadensis TaxID=72917 RepID=UPI001CB8D7A0|nr:early nodulin-like protein 2 [Erigeron canadensis]